MTVPLAPFGASYMAGDWVAVAGRRTWLVTELAPDSPVVRDVWGLLSDDVDHLDLLDVLVRGIGLKRLPSFGLVGMADGVLTIILRGSALARVQFGAERATFNAGDSVTWAEHRLAELPSQVELTGEAQALNGALLPLTGGVVRANRLVLQLVAQEDVAPTNAGPAPLSTAISSAPPEPPRGVAEVVQAVPDLPDELTPPVVEAPPLPESTLSASTTRSFVDAGEVIDAADRDVSEQEASSVAPVAEAPASDERISYDDLFGRTVQRSVEEAAVRPDEDETVVQPLANAQPTRDPLPPPSGPETLPTPAITDVPEPLELPVRPGLIDRVPWAASEPRGTHPAPPPPRTTATSPPVGTDGLTVDRTTHAALLAQMAASSPPPVLGPTVHAVRCSRGHPNPAHAVSCRVCRTDLPDQSPITVPRPVLGVLRMSTGDVIPLDRGVLMGRSPQADRLVGDEHPNVVRLPSPEQDISRTHLEVRLDGWHVLVTDLGSTNGTLVTLPGRPPERLRPDVPSPIEPGTVVSLADEVTFRFEVAP